MTEENQAYERLHWTEMQGNPYMFPLSLLMLTSEGEERIISCYLKGQSVKHAQPLKRKVRFDVDFVEAKIKKVVLDPLQQTDLIGVQALVSKAKEFNKSND